MAKKKNNNKLTMMITVQKSQLILRDSGEEIYYVLIYICRSLGGVDHMNCFGLR